VRDELSDLHTGECDGACEYDEDAAMHACLIDEYERNDPSWGWEPGEAQEIAAELRPPPPSKYFTPDEVRERAMQITRLHGLGK
jgi:hypothetical protein